MPRGQTAGWKLRQLVPALPPEKPVRLATGIWYQPNGRFSAYLYHRGKDRCVGVFDSIEEAATAQDAERARLRGGGAPIAKRAATVEVGAFAEERYFPTLTGRLKPSTIRSARARFNRHLKPFFDGISVCDLSYDACQKFAMDLSTTPLTWDGAQAISGQSQREALLLLRLILDEAVRLGLLPTNPARLVKLPAKASTEIVVPTYETALQTVAHIERADARLLASTLLWSGLRLGEALALRWPKVSLDRKTFHVDGTVDPVTRQLQAPKTKRAVRIVDVPSALIDLFRIHRECQLSGKAPKQDPWVFAVAKSRSDGGSPVIDQKNFCQRHFDPARDSVSTERFTPHSFRHLYAIELLQRAPIEYVSAQLGHASPAFTYRQYVHWLPRNGRDPRAWIDATFQASA